MPQQITLTHFGKADNAFKLEQTELEAPKEGQVQIEVEASGLNFADVMARRGMYAPVNKLPFILGYDVVGKISAVGAGGNSDLIGKRVVSLTRFGGYKSHVNVPELGVVILQDEISTENAISFSTAFLTAYLMVEEYAGLSTGKNALVYSAAGGVGYYLYQFLKLKGIEVQPVVGSASKIDFLKQNGFDENILLNQDIDGHKDKYDLIFNARGGKTVKRDKALLKPGAKLVMFGAADQLNSSGIIGKLKLLFGFGFHSPIQLIVKSQSLCGFNLLGLSSEHPLLVTKAHKTAVDLIQSNNIKPLAATGFSPDKISDAHNHLESGNSTGKIFIDWRKN